MTPNPTSAPATQELTSRQLAEAYFYSKFPPKAYSVENLAQDAEIITFAMEFAEICVKATVQGLAEEADKKHEECRRAGIGNFSNWSGVAAWLREKAQ